MKPKCKDCCYFGIIKVFTDYDANFSPVCRRNPPVFNSRDSEYCFPTIDPENDWCGEFKNDFIQKDSTHWECYLCGDMLPKHTQPIQCNLTGSTVWICKGCSIDDKKNTGKLQDERKTNEQDEKYKRRLRNFLRLPN